MTEIAGQLIVSPCDNMPATNMCLTGLNLIYEVQEIALGTLTISIGLFSFFVIVRNSPKEMSEYKWLLMHSTVWDLAAGVFMCFLMAPTPLFPAVAYIVRGPVQLPGLGAACLMLNLFIASQLSINLCFAYRYAVLSRLKAGSKLWRQFLPSILAILAFGVIAEGALAYTNMTAATSDQNTAISNILSQRPHWNIEIKQYTIVALKQFGNGQQTPLAMALFFAFGGNVAISVTFFLLIHRQLKIQQAILSNRTLRMHRRLTMALVVQFVLPMLCYLVPIIVNYILVRFQIINDIISVISTSSCLYYHPFSFIATIYFSNPYRRATLAMIRQLPGGHLLISKSSVELTQLTLAAGRRTTIVPQFQIESPELHSPAKKRWSKVFFIKMS